MQLSKITIWWTSIWKDFREYENCYFTWGGRGRQSDGEQKLLSCHNITVWIYSEREKGIHHMHANTWISLYDKFHNGFETSNISIAFSFYNTALHGSLAIPNSTQSKKVARGNRNLWGKHCLCLPFGLLCLPSFSCCLIGFLKQRKKHLKVVANSNCLCWIVDLVPVEIRFWTEYPNHSLLPRPSIPLLKTRVVFPTPVTWTRGVFTGPKFAGLGRLFPPATS